jgi:hypothetical protein
LAGDRGKAFPLFLKSELPKRGTLPLHILRISPILADVGFLSLKNEPSYPKNGVLIQKKRVWTERKQVKNLKKCHSPQFRLHGLKR